MKNIFKVLVIIALVTIIGFLMSACGEDGGGGVKEYKAENIEALAAWLAKQPANTVKTAYKVKLNVSFLGDVYQNGSAGRTIFTNSNKYVSLDLSGSSFNSIGDSAFLLCENLTKVTIPAGVTSIGDFAFRGCTSLASLTIPASVTSIGNYTFYDCTSLTSVTIPDKVTTIGNSCFYDCTSLTSVDIKGSVISIESEVFYGCRSLTSVTLPDSVKSIGQSSFYGCKSLIGVTIPDKVTTIGDLAFNGIGITSVTIPKSVTSIGVYAFSNCKSLTSVTFAKDSNITAANFGKNAFPEGIYGSGGDLLKNIYNPATSKDETYTRAANGTWAKQ